MTSAPAGTSEMDHLDQLDADGRIGGRGAWIKSEAQQHHQIPPTTSNVVRPVGPIHQGANDD